MSSAVDSSNTPNEKPSSGWVERLVRATWHSFKQKLTAALSAMAAVTALLTFALGSTIPSPVRLGGAIACASILVLMAVFYAGRALVTLAREGEKLAVEKDKAWEQVRSLNQEKAEWQSESQTASRATRLASALCGIVYYDYELDCHLLPDGAFTIDSKIAMAALVDRVTEMEHYVYAPHAPDSWDEVIELKAEDKDDKQVLIKAVPVEKKARVLYWLLRAIPEFTKGHRIVYSYKETLPADSFTMTESAMKERGLAWEYFAVRISWPTEHFCFRVTLPSGFVPASHEYDVWLGDRGKVTQSDEYNRLRKNQCWQAKRNADRNELIFELDVKFPIHCLYYVIKWQPPNPEEQ
jgi:hypothetical protein